MRKCVVTETVQNYKCPCCGSPLSFDGKTQNMHCKSCGNDFSAETMQQLEGENKKSHYDWDNYEPRSFSEAEQGGFASYTCPSCGASNTGKFCSECGAPKPSAEWTCSCGAVNKGKFCSECGKPRQ